MPTPDIRVYKQIGKRATEITGCRAVSVYHDFRYDLKDLTYGAADDWAFEYLGIFAWTTELWSPLQRAGFKDYHFIEWFRDHPDSDDITLLRWFDNNFAGAAFVDWHPFEHPELGPIEIGGLDTHRYWSNAPPAMLLDEVSPHTEFALYHCLISPRLELRSAGAEAAGEGLWRVRLVVQNTGWLPTNVTQKAVDRRAVRPLEVELTIPEDAELVLGERKVELGQLTGRALRNSALRGSADETTDRAKAEWLIRAPAGSLLQVQARHDRAGVVRADVRLGD
jgi:murein tripeptide amidase MpaA